jgi:hypothetical protein
MAAYLTLANIITDNKSYSILLRTGALVYGKREFLNHKKYSTAAKGDSDGALLRSGSGVAGRCRRLYPSRLRNLGGR